MAETRLYCTHLLPIASHARREQQSNRLARLLVRDGEDAIVSTARSEPDWHYMIYLPPNSQVQDKSFHAQKEIASICDEFVD